MKKFVLSILLCFSIFSPVIAVDIEQNQAVQTFHYAIPDEECTIDNHKEATEEPFPSELELRGSVIYDESSSAEIDLDKNVVKPKIRLKKAGTVTTPIKKDVYSSQIQMPEKSALSNASRYISEEYSIKPIWSYVREQIGNFSYGTEYSTFIDTTEFQTSMNLYTRYDFKHFAITGSVGKTEKNIQGVNDSVIKIAPEIKLSKSFVIRDTVQAYVNTPVKKNRVSIIYTPQWQKNPDTIRIELGVTNSYYTGGRVNSAIEFMTRIKL